MLKGVVIGFICFVVFLFLHVILFHFRKIQHRFTTLVWIFYSLIPLYILLYILVPADALVMIPADPRITLGNVIGLSKIFNFLIGLVMYLFLYFGYCQFYFIVDRSVSIRIMIELEKNPQKQMTKSQIMQAYDLDDFMVRRLEHMLQRKYIIEKNGFYINTAKGRLHVKLFKFLKDFLHLGLGG